MQKENEVVQGLWEDQTYFLEVFSPNERIIVLRGLDTNVGKIPVQGITGRGGVRGINDSGESLVKMGAEKIVTDNTYFRKKRKSINIHGLARSQGMNHSLNTCLFD